MKRMNRFAHLLCFVLTTAILGPAFLLTSASARTEENVVPIYNCDKAFGGFKVDTANAQEGKACLSYTFSAGVDSFVCPTALPVTDCTGTDVLIMELYVSDPDMIRHMSQLYLELTSSGIHDKEEMAWPMQMKLSDLKAGWNTVYLYVEDGAPTGTINWARVNFMRIFAFYDGAAMDGEVLKIDNLRMAYVGGVDYSDLSLTHNHKDNPTGELLVKGLETAPVIAERDSNITVSCGKKK